MSDESSNKRAACDDAACFIPSDRRRFIRDSMFTVLGALVAAGCSRTTALGMPVGFASGVRAASGPLQFAIPAADGATIDKENEVILVRWQGLVYAFNLSCPHQNTALRWDASATRFECPKHHSEFKPDGDYVPGSGRATRAMDRFAIVRNASGVSVDLDKLYEQDKDTAAWTAAVAKV